MAKLIILQGTPCAGKSTWAKEQVAGKDDWIVVSRDAIRHGLGDYWVLRREKYVSAIEDEMMRTAFRMQLNVINDGTNLEPDRLSHLNKIAEEFIDVITETKTLYVPFREAVRRDMNTDRPHRIGETEIRKFYQKHFPDRLQEELSQPEPQTPAAPAPLEIDRIMTDTEGNPIWFPTVQDLDNLKKLAMLRYKISAIALALEVPESELRRFMTNPDSPVYKAYHAGKIEGELPYRDKVHSIASQGEEWAIRMVERWNQEQLKEELGFQIGG